MSVNAIFQAKGKASDKVQDEVSAIAVKRGNAAYVRPLLQAARFSDKNVRAMTETAAKAVEADKKAKAKAKKKDN